MRLRVVLTNGLRTIDLIWLLHNGSDIYYGYVKDPHKHSYHKDGKRHSKSATGDFQKIQQHQPLKDFRQQLQLCSFGFTPRIVEDPTRPIFTGKRVDSILYLDTRTLPDMVNVSLGLLEPGGYRYMLPIHVVPGVDLRQILLVTNTRPWIYLQVMGVGDSIGS